LESISTEYWGASLKTLAIDTSTRESSLALLEDERLLAEIRLGSDVPTTSAITPALKRLLTEQNWTPAMLDLLAVSIGPGSFTGLRIGVMTVKAIAYVTRCHVRGIHTMRAIAYRFAETDRPIHVVTDAQRRQFFHAVFQRQSSGELIEIQPTQIIDQATFSDSLSSSHAVTGTGLKKIAKDLPGEVLVADESLWECTSEAVGRLAIEDFRNGIEDDFWTIKPQYFRKSAAEEKLEGSSG